MIPEPQALRRLESEAFDAVLLPQGFNRAKRKHTWVRATLMRHEELSGRTFNVIYGDDDPAKLLREEPAPPEAVGPKDGLMGAGFVERSLTTLLDGSVVRTVGGN